MKQNFYRLYHKPIINQTTNTNKVPFPQDCQRYIGLIQYIQLQVNDWFKSHVDAL